MKFLQQLRAALQAKLDEMRGLSESVVDKDGKVRAFTEDEQKRYDGLKAEVETTRAAIVRAEEEERSREDLARLDQVERKAPNLEIVRAENHNEKGEYRGFKSLGEQLRAVHAAEVGSGSPDKRLQEVRAAAGMNETNDSDGAFLLQSDFIVNLDKGAVENANLHNMCAKLPVGPNSNGTEEPYLNETSRADGSRNGGARAYWEGEAATLTKSQLSFDSLSLKLRKLTALCVVTDEMLKDAAFLGGYISEIYNDEMGFAYDVAIYEGSGVKEPKGFFGTDAYLAVAKNGSQGADTIIAQNCTDMYAAATPRAQRQGIWLINPQGWGQLPLMTIGQQPVFIPPGGLTGQPHGTLLGRPVISFEACSKLGDNGDFVFIDPKAYRIIEQGATEQAQSIHVYFDSAQTAFRFIKRANGAPRYKKTITPYKANSGFKLAAFVGVADRA